MAIIDWQNLIKLEIIKYKTKGFKLIVSFLFFLSFIYFIPLLFSKYYHLMPYENKVMFIGFGSFLSHFLAWFVSNAIFIFLYWAKIPAVERCKVHNVPWIWETDPKFKETLKHILKVAFVNQFIISPFYCTLAAKSAKFDVSPQIPDFYTNFKQFIFFIVAEDFAFFWSHWLLHTKYLYRFHKTHHEFVVNASFAAEHANPIEYLFANLLSATFGPLLYGQSNVHVTTLFAWLVYKTQSVANSHSGYDLIINSNRFFPFGSSPRYHDYHHLVNIGNYSNNFIFWDTLLGLHRHYCKAIEEGKVKME